MRVARWLVALALALAIARPASADPPDPKLERADELFAEAKALEATNLPEACNKFAQSLRYNPAAIGTLLNVALCDEKLGRIASAVGKFIEARDRSREQGLPEHLRAAEDHLAALQPRVPHLAIRLTEQLSDTKVLVDDRVIDPDTLGDIPLDPGPHTVTVSAPDRLPHRAPFTIDPAEHKAIVIPALARAVIVINSRRRIGQIATITGGAVFGTSIGLALWGRHLYRQQFDLGRCTSLPTGVASCNTAGQTQTDKARTFGNVATVVGGIGLAAAAAGAVIWYLAPRGFQDAPRVALDVTVDRVGVVAVGRF